jgi:hypothetical protein
MATEPRWFYQWFADAWFPPVWFAPADEEHLVEDEIVKVGGVPDRPKKRRRPGMIYNPQPVIEPRRAPREEDEALLLCAAL